MQQVDIKPQASSLATVAGVQMGACIPFGEGVYNQVMHFLIKEAHLLDNGQLKEWVQLLADDILYSMPVRQSLNRKRGDGRSTLYWMREDKDMLTFKAERLLGDSAWANEPPSRVRRMVTNMLLHETSMPGEYLVQSYILLQRNTSDEHSFHPFSARRDDILRQTDQGWLLAKRDILVDQAVIGQPNIAFFV